MKKSMRETVSKEALASAPAANDDETNELMAQAFQHSFEKLITTKSTLTLPTTRLEKGALARKQRSYSLPSAMRSANSVIGMTCSASTVTNGSPRTTSSIVC